MVAPHSDVVPEHWVVLLKPFASAETKDAHLSSIQSMTQDSRTPFSCKTHHEFNLPECRGYSGKFNLQTKENIEQMDAVRISFSYRLLLLSLMPIFRSYPLSRFAIFDIASEQFRKIALGD
jgi:hypothetical protein